MIGGVRLRRMVRRFGRSCRNGCGIFVKNESTAVAANPDKLDGVCRGSNGGFPFLGSWCLCTHLRAFTRSARFRAPTVGTPGSCGKPGRRALCASTQWHAALSTRSHALPAGTPSRTRWHTARALFSPHCRLSRLSYARTVSRTWCLHQKTPSRECGAVSLASACTPRSSTVSLSARRSSAPMPICLPSTSVGRLATLSASPGLDAMVATSPGHRDCPSRYITSLDSFPSLAC